MSIGEIYDRLAVLEAKFLRLKALFVDDLADLRRDVDRLELELRSVRAEVAERLAEINRGWDR